VGGTVQRATKTLKPGGLKLPLVDQGSEARPTRPARELYQVLPFVLQHPP
jgi:hypothetical protein